MEIGETPLDRVVNVEGKRPVKIEGGCSLEMCRGRLVSL